MLWWAKELLSCVRFLTVTGKETFFRSKRIYEIVLPTALTLLFIALYRYKPTAFAASFLKDYSSNLFQFMIFVVPFHLAALAAFATYKADILDETLSGSNAQLKVWSNQDNQYFYKDLTLRQYVSLLFGYLCSIGILYVIAYVFLSNIDMQVVLGTAFPAAKFAAAIVSVFFVFHYVILTVYAITFLFDKANKVRSI